MLIPERVQAGHHECQVHGLYLEKLGSSYGVVNRLSSAFWYRGAQALILLKYWEFRIVLDNVVQESIRTEIVVRRPTLFILDALLRMLGDSESDDARLMSLNGHFNGDFKTTSMKERLESFWEVKPYGLAPGRISVHKFLASGIDRSIVLSAAGMYTICVPGLVWQYRGGVIYW